MRIGFPRAARLPDKFFVEPRILTEQIGDELIGEEPYVLVVLVGAGAMAFIRRRRHRDSRRLRPLDEAQGGRVAGARRARDRRLGRGGAR